MKLYRRALFDLLALISALLFIALAVSYKDNFFLTVGNVGQIESVRGSWVIYGKRAYAGTWQLRPRRFRLVILNQGSRIARNFKLSFRTDREWPGMIATEFISNEHFGFGIGTGVAATDASMRVPAANTPTVGTIFMLRGCYAPTWFLMLLAAILPVLRIFRFRHRRLVTHRAQNGLCRHCGYDLRATPERCPECGTVPDKPLISK
jgi:hypothetical protein